MIFNRKPTLEKPEDIIFKLEPQGTITNSLGMATDLYLLYWNKGTLEVITMAVPHGREDIAQYIQERLNKV